MLGFLFETSGFHTPPPFSCYNTPFISVYIFIFIIKLKVESFSFFRFFPNSRPARLVKGCMRGCCSSAHHSYPRLKQKKNSSESGGQRRRSADRWGGGSCCCCLLTPSRLSVFCHLRFQTLQCPIDRGESTVSVFREEILLIPAPNVDDVVAIRQLRLNGHLDGVFVHALRLNLRAGEGF